MLDFIKKLFSSLTEPRWFIGPARLESLSSGTLWYLERWYHSQWCQNVWGQDARNRYMMSHCDKMMARCKAELDRRGVTHTPWF